MSAALFFDGKKYISSKQASVLTGYSKDYIGQLIRSNKLRSKRIGPVWYVSEESVLNYKNFANKLDTLPGVESALEGPETITKYLEPSDSSLTPDPEAPVETEKLFKGYISIKEAGSLTGYSQGYIGQLARGGKIYSKKIGRVWYVGEESVLNYKKFSDKLELLAEISADEKVQAIQNEPVKSKLEKVSAEVVPPAITPVNQPRKTLTFPEKTKRIVLSNSTKLSFFTVSMVLVVGLFYWVDNRFPLTAENSSTKPTNFLTANSIDSLTDSPTTSDSLYDAFKNYISSAAPTPGLDGKTLTSAFKNYVSPPKVAKKITPSVAVKSPQTRNTLDSALLLSSLRTLLAQADIVEKLRGPQGPQGLPGQKGVTTAYPQIQSVAPSAPSAIPATYIPAGIAQPNPSQNFNGAPFFNATHLSTNQFSTNEATVTDLSVKGNIEQTIGSTSLLATTITGATTIVGATTITGATTFSGGGTFRS